MQSAAMPTHLTLPCPGAVPVPAQGPRAPRTQRILHYQSNTTPEQCSSTDSSARTVRPGWPASHGLSGQQPSAHTIASAAPPMMTSRCTLRHYDQPMHPAIHPATLNRP
jgi:hypothetical protein